jgi:hypothetical protein
MDKIRIVVEMHGGTIQSVATDAGIELDVVFLEAKKYVEDAKTFAVKSGPFKGEVVYSHYSQDDMKPAELDPVFEAAQERLDDDSDDAEEAK